MMGMIHIKLIIIDILGKEAYKWASILSVLFYLFSKKGKLFNNYDSFDVY